MALAFASFEATWRAPPCSARIPPPRLGNLPNAGFSWLHVVDLNGAFAGRSVNGEAVKAIRAAVDLRIQLGGGIRDRAAIEEWLALGIDRVVLGCGAAHLQCRVSRLAVPAFGLAGAGGAGAVGVGADAAFADALRQ